MKIGGRDLPDTTHLKHWLTVVSDTVPAQRLLEDELQKTAQLTLDASEKLAAELRDEGIDHPIIGKIQKLIKNRGQHTARWIPIWRWLKMIEHMVHSLAY